MPWPNPPRKRIVRSDRPKRPDAARAAGARAAGRLGARACAAVSVLGLAGVDALPALAGPSPQRTVRVRAASKGEPDGASTNPQISGDGRFVAFETAATNLGPADPNGDVRDVYLFDDKTGEIRLLSAPPGGGGADGPSGAPSISGDGGVVAFFSQAANLVSGASNGAPGVFAWSRDGGVQRVSVSSTQASADGDSREPDLSADGRMVAFSSTAGNLAAGHPAGQRDVYVRDRGAGQTMLVSATPDGKSADGDSSAPAISPDGRYVSFSTTATNLVAGVTTHGPNVVVRDLVSGTTDLVSVSSAGDPQSGDPAAGPPLTSDVSSGGRYVVFDSGATNLVGGDTNGHTDIFVRDRMAKRTFRASLATTDQQGDGDSLTPSISADGRYVTFLSRAPNLTPSQPRGENAFVRDLQRNTTVMADVSSSGTPRGRKHRPQRGGQVSQRPSSADDGSAVVFVSSATNLVAGKTSHLADLFLRRLVPTPITFASPAVRLVRGHVVITFVSGDPQAGPLLCRLDRRAVAICPLGVVVLPLLKTGKHLLTAFAGGPGSAYAQKPTRVRIVVKRGGRARVKVSNPGAALGFG